MNVMKNKKGFTLMEMLIVVAIIAVLVAIAIPVLSNNLHKARVAADWANVRALYANLQADYMITGEEIYEYSNPTGFPHYELHFYSDGQITQTIPLQAGYCFITMGDAGYQIHYCCNVSGHPDCVLQLGIKNTSGGN